MSANTTVTSDRLATGAGVTHTLGTLSIGAQTLTINRGSLATSGTGGITFGATTLTGNAIFSPQSNSLLTVSTVATFAASWLVPRLGRFNQRHPHIEVRVEATSAVMDLRRDRIDAALRHGLGVYPNLHVTQLMAPVLVPVLPLWLQSPR